MKRLIVRASLIFAALIIAVIISNLSWFYAAPSGSVKLLAHRGVHQTFHRQNLTNETCTAERIFKPKHPFLENTIPSIKAAFDYGADMVEIDTLPTADGHFVVFHDWTVDCRTNGHGRTTDLTLDHLQSLDIGYGYTADGGKTYPFRGESIGMMPSLKDVLLTFPGRAFMINLKSNRAADADMLAAYLKNADHQLGSASLLWTGHRAANRWRALQQPLPVTTRREVKNCAKNYILLGWLGTVPEACSTFGLVVPQDFSWLYWGWPNGTLFRFTNSGSRVFIAGALTGDRQGIDTIEQLQEIPDGFDGWVMTDRIEVVGPALKPK